MPSRSQHVLKSSRILRLPVLRGHRPRRVRVWQEDGAVQTDGHRRAADGIPVLRSPDMADLRHRLRSLHGAVLLARLNLLPPVHSPTAADARISANGSTCRCTALTRGVRGSRGKSLPVPRREPHDRRETNAKSTGVRPKT